MRKTLAAAFISVSALACSKEVTTSSPSTQMSDASATVTTEVTVQKDINEIARQYVALALAFGEYDPDYVDAYTGPQEWRDAAIEAEKPLHDLFAEATSLAADLTLVEPLPGEERRLQMLQGNVQAMLARMRMVRGETLSFDEETALIYDVVVPPIDPAQFDEALAALDAVLPGEGTVAERRAALHAQLEVPEDKVEAMIVTAIDECRKRTRQYYELPDKEKFALELVRNKPWSGYNWYQGDYESLIQINLDQPFRVTRALDLGCHEGYPGHHVWNIFVERERLKERNWIEYYVFPLFSPGAFFAEGSANYGVDIAFPGEEKIRYERDVLYPMADIDPALADILPAVDEASRKLQFVRVYVARKYLDGELSREQAVETIQKYELVSKERAEQSVDFIETYRGYVINYSLGYNMVKAYIEANAVTTEERWSVFEEMLREPTSASNIVLD